MTAFAIIIAALVLLIGIVCLLGASDEPDDPDGDLERLRRDAAAKDVARALAMRARKEQ